MRGNIFTTKLIDVIVNSEAKHDIGELKRVFLVMEHVDYDFKGMLKNKID